MTERKPRRPSLASMEKTSRRLRGLLSRFEGETRHLRGLSGDASRAWDRVRDTLNDTLDAQERAIEEKREEGS